MASPKPRVLVVDDDNTLLKIFRNSLDETRFDFDAAVSGALALEKLRDAQTPYEVIVSDMLMPGMDGVELLRKCRESYPDMVRILLTGSGDITLIAEAINQADVFRFIPKPIRPVKLNVTIQDAVKHHHLLINERDLLQNTLVQSVDALVKILEVTNGVAFALTEHVREYSVRLGKVLNVQQRWGLEIAALLSQVGCITIPELILERFYWGESLSPKEESMIKGHGEVAKSIIVNIPRLTEVAEVVAQAARFVDFKGFEAGATVAVHAAIIRMVTEVDMLQRRGRSKDEILAVVDVNPPRYPEVLINQLKEMEFIEPHAVTVELHVDKIKNGMYIKEDVKTKDGVLIVSNGYRVNETVRNRLINFSEEGVIDHLVKVLVCR
jgi:response regulator RpfG family c-di-GMP phosphodiesterase